MPRGWIVRLPMAALLLSAAVTLSGCNMIGGTISGAGKDLRVLGSALGGDCGRRCSSYKRDCGPRGCRPLRQVVSRCTGRDCALGYRAVRRQQVSYRGRSNYRR